jgi:hypothetical protein
VGEHEHDVYAATAEGWKYSRVVFVLPLPLPLPAQCRQSAGGMPSGRPGDGERGRWRVADGDRMGMGATAVATGEVEQVEPPEIALSGIEQRSSRGAISARRGLERATGGRTCALR